MEIILLLILIAIIPLAVLAGIIKFIIWLVREYKNRNNPSEQAVEKTVRKFSGSEIMLIIGTLFIVLSGIAFGCAGWVNTSPSGRVAIMIMAVIMMSIAGEVFRKIIKLDRTATAFEIISTILTAITVITAGNYGLFGEWLSYQGMNVLFALSSAVTGLTSFMHWKLSGNKVFKYSAYLSVTATVIFLASEVENDSLFALIMLFMQILVTAVYVFVGIKDDIIKKSVKISVVVFELCSLYYAVDKMFVPDMTSYVVMIVTWIQLVFYGIYLKKSDLKALQSILSIFITFIFIDNMAEYDDKQIILASMIFALIYIANRFIPYIRSTFSEVLTLGFAVYISIASATLDNNFALIIPVIVSGLIMSYTFTGNKFVQAVAGLGSPILPVIIACSIYEYEWFVIIMSLVTFAIMRYTERKTDIVLYANMFVSGGIIFLWAMDSPENIFMIPIACGFHIAVSCMLKNNFTGILSALALIIVTEELEMSEYKILVFFCCLMALAKIFYKENLRVRNIGTKKYDIITFSAWIIFFMVDDTFINLMIIAVYSACLVRRKTKRLTTDILLSLSAFFTTLAMVNRPFFTPSTAIIDDKITLAMIAVMGIAYRLIWKNSPKLSKTLSNVIFILSFSGLTYDIMYYHRLGNTIFGLAVTGVILIISFSAKSRIWFGASSIALVTITVWASIRYLGKADWWVYLFIAGIIFIGVASISEYLKTKNKSISGIFSDWKW
ncbi:MAG: hypothetical protein K2J32_03590 [Ruminococcus sp.]|nr:hypothetical protein [Ruminococcus sp.]